MYIDVTKFFNSSKFDVKDLSFLAYIYSIFIIYFFQNFCLSCFVAFCLYCCRCVGIVVEYQIVYQFNDSHF